ncbi:hypothetical protein D3C81_983820 [compost metagenome]
MKLDLVPLRCLLEDFAAGDVRWQQVRGELDAPHTGFQMGGQRLDRARLGQPWQALQQDVTIGQQAKYHMANGFGLAQHALRHTGFERGNLLAYIHCPFLVSRGIDRRPHGCSQLHEGDEVNLVARSVLATSLGTFVRLPIRLDALQA